MSLLQRRGWSASFLHWNHFVLAALWLAAILFLVRNVSQLSNPKESIDTLEIKNILYYTPFWNHKDYGFGLGTDPFVQKCSGRAQRCFVTDDRQHLESMGDFDAVIFHAVDFQTSEIPRIQQWRKQHQRFVYFNMESPQTYSSLSSPNNFYNWTITYRQDSDIPKPAGWFELTSSPKIYAPPLQTGPWPIMYNQDDFLKQDLSSLTHLAQRPKKVAWIVSKCNTASRRNDYVRKLSKYIGVDIFGKCGTTPCDLTHQQGKNTFDNCTLAVQREYKFYLGFENTLCKDYATEKFFSRVNNSVVIVMGATNYTQVAPPRSFINVMDHAGPKELADYLLKLDQNDDMYLSYFWWKQYYTVKYGNDVQHQAFCRLCDKLHEKNEPAKSYADLHDWQSNRAHCGETQVPGMPLPLQAK